MLSEQEILKKYKLTDEEHEQFYHIIKRVWTDNKFPVKNPIAVVIGGQTGAGKSGIISYSKKMFVDDNVVIINSDEIKPFHPKSEEIATKYPELYTKITDQESNTWTSRLFEEVRAEGYNLIFEGTMKNNRVADESIVEMRDRGYTVIVRGIAVCDLESRVSIFERYMQQVTTRGWGRLVVPEHHNQTYQGMPNTIDYIEQTGKYDILEIFKRGFVPDSPFLIYSKHNSASIEKTRKAIEGKNFVTGGSSPDIYLSAKDAILKGREKDYPRVLPTCEERFRGIQRYIKERAEVSSNIQMESAQIKEIIDIYQQKKMELYEKKTDNPTNGDEQR